MRITEEMTLRPTENGHILCTKVASGYKELNLPGQLEALRLMEAVCHLQNIIDIHNRGRGIKE